MVESTENGGNRHVAVLIDFENVGLGSISRLFDQISTFGRIIVKRAYADWASNNSSRDQLLELGLEPIHLVRGAASGKNASDIRLVIDALDLLYQSPVDTFVIVSSDSDFLPLVHKLRSAGKSVIGAGPRATAARSFVGSCDRYIYLDSLVAPQHPATASAKQPERPSDSLLVRALRACMDEQGRTVGGKLHTTMLRLDPGFDYKEQGYSTFSRFLEASKDVKVLWPKDSPDMVVEVAEAQPTAARGRRRAANAR